MGAQWRIGNGENISIWRDPWLKNNHDSFVKSPMVVGTEGFRECLFKFLQTLSKAKIPTLVAMIWALWRRCNTKLWEGSMQSVSMKVSNAKDYMQEWQAARVRTQPASSEIHH